MIAHITFSDGSNPWVMYGTEEQCVNAIEQWERDYILIQQQSVIENALFYYAYDKAE